MRRTSVVAVERVVRSRARGYLAQLLVECDHARAAPIAPC